MPLATAATTPAGAGDRMTRPTVIALGVAALIGLGAVVGPPPTHSAEEQVIHVTARKFEYEPREITIKKGVPVVLEITSIDRDHGFKLRDFGIRADIKPGETTRVRLLPNKI